MTTEFQYAVFKNGIELYPGDFLYRIGMVLGEKLYVYRCPVFYCNRHSARIISAIPWSSSNGLKPERIRQFNQINSSWYETITVKKYLEIDLWRFCRNLKLPQQIPLTIDQPHHPLHDIRSRKAERFGFIQ